MQKAFWRYGVFAILLLVAAGYARQSAKLPQTLPEARRGFATHLLVKTKTPDPVLDPPAGIRLVRYHAPLGDFPAYLTTPSSGGRHPAIVWLTGGFDNSIGSSVWEPASPANDQSARAFREAGIITMYPSLRGGNNNPGNIENLYGEVDDALAAAAYLAAQPDVDPHRVYLGGHSTGGTLALLVAESNSGFRSVFAFGPVSSVAGYGKGDLTFDYKNMREIIARAPILFLNTIACPTFILEGTSAPGNTASLHQMRARCANPKVRFYDLPGLNHFSELAAITPIIARQIAGDTGAKPGISFASESAKIAPAN